MARILVVDDEAPVREALRALLERRGHAVTEAANGLEALEVFAGNAFDLVLSDVVMPEMNGFDLLKALQPQIHERVPFVILSSHDDREGIRAAIYAGAFDYLAKPFEESHVAQVIDRALEQAGAWTEVPSAPVRTVLEKPVQTPVAAPEPAPSGVAAFARAEKVLCVPSPASRTSDPARHAGPWGRLLGRLIRR